MRLQFLIQVEPHAETRHLDGQLLRDSIQRDVEKRLAHSTSGPVPAVKVIELIHAELLDVGAMTAIQRR